MQKELSGPIWTKRFPTSKKVEDLAEPFKSNVSGFIQALRAAGAKVNIAATVRPAERAYLMHYSFLIAKKVINPAAVPARTGVNIEWVHKDAAGKVNSAASVAAAKAMVVAYGIVSAPALDSNHISGKAIDMTISWQGNLNIANANGTKTNITTGAKNGSNKTLHKVGSTYKAIKLVSDPPHWSSDGH